MNVVIDTNIIRRDLDFRKKIENLQSIITDIPEEIKLITIDYTLTSNSYYIRQKYDKYYQSSDRFLVVVLLGKKNPSTVDDLRDELRDLADRDRKTNNGRNYYDNIRIITAEEYKKFLGFDGLYAKTYDEVQTLGYTVFEGKFHDKLREIWEIYSEYLSTFSPNWVNSYLKQY